MSEAVRPQEGDLFAEMYRLTAAIRERTLTQEQADRLEALVCGSPDARDLYLLLTLESLELSRWATPSDGVPLAASAIRAIPQNTSRWRRLPRGIYEFISNYTALSVLVAALLLTNILLSLSLIVLEPVADSSLTTPVESGPAARITQTYHTAWGHGSHGSFRRTELDSGDRLLLTSGLAEITFASGARVVLEGPAELIIGVDAAQPVNEAKPLAQINAAFLQSGKLVARLDDERANGFTIVTPLMQIEDLGTEFAVQVDGDGETGVQVFEGKVRLRDASGEAFDELVAGAAGLFSDDGSGRPARLDAPKFSQFARFVPKPATKDVAWTPDATRRPIWDGYVWAQQPDEVHSGESVLYVKTADRHPDWDREAWICFDLGDLDTQHLVDADLVLTLAPIWPEEYEPGDGLGWRFGLQGMLIDDALLPTGETLTWNGTRQFTGRLLAEFYVGAAPEVGATVRCGGERLVQFLREHQGGRIVIMIERITSRSVPNIVHAFDGSETGEAGPVLYLKYQEPNKERVK